MNKAALAFLTWVLSCAPLAQTLEEVAAQFERPLYCGQRIWSEAETSSFIKAAVAFAPHLAPNPRIAGTSGVISTTARRGFYGGIFLGPIKVSKRELRYDRMTFWGDLSHPWEFLPSETYRAILTDAHPTWLLLVDTNLEDEVDITEAQATTIVSRSKALSDLSLDEIRKFHRFEISLFHPSDVISRRSETPWWNAHYVITAKSQEPGSHQNVYQGGVQFALTDRGLKYMRTLPAYDVFELPGLAPQRVCDLPER